MRVAQPFGFMSKGDYTDKGGCIMISITGYKKEELDVWLHYNVISISAGKKIGALNHVNCSHFTLPENVELDSVKAIYQNQDMMFITYKLMQNLPEYHRKLEVL